METSSQAPISLMLKLLKNFQVPKIVLNQLGMVRTRSQVLKTSGTSFKAVGDVGSGSRATLHHCQLVKSFRLHGRGARLKTPSPPNPHVKVGNFTTLI